MKRPSHLQKGTYTCDITGVCETITSDMAVLSLEGSLSVDTNPAAQALGLSLPEIGVDIGCLEGSAIISWDGDPPTPMTAMEAGIVLDPPPVQTTVFQVTVTDSASMEMATASAVVLVAVSPDFDDYNGDGCNNQLDLWELGAQWREAYPDDANGDGIITVLDLMYINLSSTCL